MSGEVQARILDQYGQPFEERSSAYQNFGSIDDFADWIGGQAEADSGVRVTGKTALGYPPLWRGINLLSSDVAKLPRFVFRALQPRGRERDKAHPAYRLVRWKPNEETTAFTFWQTVASHAIYRGNGYAYIVRDQHAVPLALWQLSPGDVVPLRVGRSMWYICNVYLPDGRTEQRKIPSTDMLHVKGLGFDGLCGYDLIRLARDSLGLGMAAAKYGSMYFANGGAPSVVLEFPGHIDPETAKRHAQSWSKMHAGLDNSHMPAVLTRGGKASVLNSKARDAQLLETRAYEARQAANLLNVPPHKLGISNSAYPSSIEQDNQQYLNEALDPWLVRIEEECRDKLLTEREKETESHTIEFERKALLRADLGTRSTFYQMALQNRLMVVNEVRDVENLNPVQWGDEPNPAPNASLPAPDEEPDDDPDGDPDEEPDDQEDRQRVAREALERLAKRITGRARRRGAMDDETYRGWLAMAAHEQRDFIGSTIAPVLRLAGGARGSVVAAQMVEWICEHLAERKSIEWIDQAAPVMFSERLFKQLP